MVPDIADKQALIADIGRRFGVRRLTLVGSAARGDDFDSGRSDFDFVVVFGPEEASLERYFGLREALSALLGRPVDLIVEGTIRNPFVRREIERAMVTVFAA